MDVKPSAGKRTVRRLAQLAVAVLACMLVAAGLIVAAGLGDQVADADMIVVPGNTVAPDGNPSPRLQARLNAALALFREHRAPLIFVSGGTGKEGFDEAVVMAGYLVHHGVPAAAIVEDSLGVDTAATARNAGRFMREHRLRSAIVATQYFHIARTKLALQRNGVQVTGTVHARHLELRDAYSIPREVVAYVAYCVKS